MGKIFKALEKKDQEAAGNSPDRRQYQEEYQGSIRLENAAAPDEGLSSGPLSSPVSAFAAEKAADSEFKVIQPQSVEIDPMLVAGLDPHSLESEQFRLLKNNILFPEKGVPPRCIMITSASPGEGKSFVAANLAISLAQNIDEYVLLMDCDLRAPNIHSMFGFDSPPGLSDYLSAARPLNSLLVKTFMEKLTILPAGRVPPNPSELLSSEQMRRLIHEVKSRYSDRYIIIDTPPPYLTSETGAIARQVDGIIVVIMQGKTRKKNVQDVIDAYGRDKILGAVYNHAKKPFGSGYGKYDYEKYNSGSR